MFHLLPRSSQDNGPILPLPHRMFPYVCAYGCQAASAFPMRSVTGRGGSLTLAIPREGEEEGDEMA